MDKEDFKSRTSRILFSFFGKSGNGDIKVQFVDNLFYGAHLPFSAVGDKKVGQGLSLIHI